MTRYEYECAVSGITEIGEEPNDSDGLDDLPVGWTKIQITRRRYNPKWLLIQQVKSAMVEGLLGQFPDDIREMQRYPVMVQIEAQFYALENDTPRFKSDVEDVVFLSDHDEILESLNDVRAQLGLEEVLSVHDDSEEYEDEEEGFEEKEEASVPAVTPPSSDEDAAEAEEAESDASPETAVPSALPEEASTAV